MAYMRLQVAFLSMKRYANKTLRSFFSHRAHSGLTPSPLRMERGVVCEVTPTELVIEGDALLNIQRTYRGISVITPLSIRRGAGGEAVWVLGDGC